MKLGLTNVDRDFNKVVEINTIEDLITLMKKYDEPIILDKNWCYGDKYCIDIPKEYIECEYCLEVYDDYRE